MEIRDTPGRSSRSDPRYGPDAFAAAKAHFLARGALARLPAADVWVARSRTGRRLSRHLGSEGVRVEAFVDVDPAKIGRTRQGVPVSPPGRARGWRGRVLLAAVGVRGARGARELIRPAARAAGFVEGVDFFCAA